MHSRIKYLFTNDIRYLKMYNIFLKFEDPDCNIE